jgi:hypothetical protein
MDWYVPKGILPVERGMRLVHIFGNPEVKKVNYRQAKKLHRKELALVLGDEFYH